jgi:rod shape-determining protein MreC
MESVLGRYRNLVILVGVLFLQVLGLAVQVKRANGVENTALIRIWAVDAITPIERSVVWVQNGAGSLWHNYFYLRGVRAENRHLKDQIEQMRLEQVRLSEDAAQARRLQSLLAFKEQYVSKTVPAQVIGSSGSDLSRSVYLDKGSDQGIQPDMAVITAEGIVGKVLRVYPSTSQVLLINDQSSGVGAVLEKTRLQGVLRGTPNGEVALERVMSDEQVPAGETVLTSGGDQIFPKGLPVGTVMKVGDGKDVFLNIRVKPAANLSKLEEVLVVVQKQERQAMAEAAPRVRAADILAQRLPSVPEKPAAQPTGGVTVPAGSTAGSAAGTLDAKPAGKPLQAKPFPPSPSQSSPAQPRAAQGSPAPAPLQPKPGANTQTGGTLNGTTTGAIPAAKPASAVVKPASSQPKASKPQNSATPEPNVAEPATRESATPKPVPPQSPPPIVEDSPH